MVCTIDFVRIFLTTKQGMISDDTVDHGMKWYPSQPHNDQLLYFMPAWSSCFPVPSVHPARAGDCPQGLGSLLSLEARHHPLPTLIGG